MRRQFSIKAPQMESIREEESDLSLSKGDLSMDIPEEVSIPCERSTSANICRHRQTNKNHPSLHLVSTIK